MKRRTVLLFIGAAALRAGSAAQAQPSSPARRRLGVLLFDRPELWAPFGAELRKALADLGWVEGSNLAVEWRFAEGNAARLPALAEAMSRSGADAILTRGTPATRALQEATKTVPIVTGVGDPVGSGFAQSLARPGGNITGISYAVVETTRKQLELLREMVPKLSRVTVAMDASFEGFESERTRMLQSAAREVGITARMLFASNADDLRKALQPANLTAGDTVLVFGIASIKPSELAAILLGARLPSMFGSRGFVDTGGLMSYRLDWENQTQRTAVQINRVLRGESPAQIPFEFPTRSELIINTKTAKALGLTIPQSLLVRADEVLQ